jgi:hypothetical protein
VQQRLVLQALDAKQKHVEAKVSKAMDADEKGRAMDEKEV